MASWQSALPIPIKRQQEMRDTEMSQGCISFKAYARDNDDTCGAGRTGKGTACCVWALGETRHFGQNSVPSLDRDLTKTSRWTEQTIKTKDEDKNSRSWTQEMWNKEEVGFWIKVRLVAMITILTCRLQNENKFLPFLSLLRAPCGKQGQTSASDHITWPGGGGHYWNIFAVQGRKILPLTN